jgi:hypothetical protein
MDTKSMAKEQSNLDPKMALKKTQIEASIDLKRQELMADLELKKTENELRKLEAHSTAKDVASKFIGKTAIPWIVLLVIVGVVSSAFLPSESLPAVIGLVSTAVMAFITMLAGITGTREKEEKPEIEIIKSLIKQLDEAREPMNVELDGDNVVVSKGNTTMKTSGKKRGR